MNTWTFSQKILHILIFRNLKKKPFPCTFDECFTIYFTTVGTIRQLLWKSIFAFCIFYIKNLVSFFEKCSYIFKCFLSIIFLKKLWNKLCSFVPNFCYFWPLRILDICHMNVFFSIFARSQSMIFFILIYFSIKVNFYILTQQPLNKERS